MTGPETPARSFGRLRFDTARRCWRLSGLPPHVALRLKAMFPKLDKTQAKGFAFADREESCADLAWFLQRYPMEMTAADRLRLDDGERAFERARATAESILAPGWRADAATRFREGKAPYPYQEQAIALTRTLRRLLLMDDVGLGKTVSALGTLAGSPYLPAAIVVQAHLASQWVDAFITPFTTLSAHVVKGTRPYRLPPADLYVFKYSNIAGWVDVAETGAFKAVVFDEIQELRRGPDSAKGRAAAVFAGAAELRLGLSATPIYNYGSEIFHVLELIEPGALGAFPDFLREWCGRSRVVKNPDALGTYLREQHLVLRRERACNPVNVVPIEVPYDRRVAAAQEELARMLAIKVTSGKFTERGKAARELDILLRQVTGIAKARHVAAYVRILLAGGAPVLLAGWHREVYDIWRAELAEFRPVLYTGTESPRQKDRAKAAFVDGDTNLMIISLRSGAGLDGLQHRCSTLVFGELDWSPRVHDQVIGRLDRPGQREEVTALFLHANGGSDPLVISLLGLKASQSRGIIDPLSGAPPIHSDESRLRLLAEQYLQRWPAAA